MLLRCQELNTKSTPSTLFSRNTSLTLITSEYLPELARAQAAREANLAAKKADSMNRLMKDLSIDRQQNPEGFANDKWEEDEPMEDDEDAELSDNDIVDRSTSRLLLLK